MRFHDSSRPHFEFRIQFLRAIFGLLPAGGMVQDDQQQPEGVLQITLFRLQTCQANQGIQSKRNKASFACQAQRKQERVLRIGIVAASKCRMATKR